MKSGKFNKIRWMDETTLKHFKNLHAELEMFDGST